MHLKCVPIFLASLLLIYVSADSSEETDIGVIKSGIRLGYEAEKAMVLSDIIEGAMMGGDMKDKRDNITVVGTQNVYNKDGSIKEIRTIALHMPITKKTSTLDEIDEDSDSDESTEEVYTEIASIFQRMGEIGMPMEAMYKEFDKGGKVTEYGYMNEDIQFVLYENIGYMNKTIRVDNKETVKAKIESLKGGNLPVTVLKYDSKGNFIEDGSIVTPELFVSIYEEESTTPEMLKTIIATLGDVGVRNLNSYEKIPKDLAMALNEKMPKYTFQITSDSDGQYVTKNMFVKANFMLTNDFDGLTYNIFGVEK